MEEAQQEEELSSLATERVEQVMNVGVVPIEEMTGISVAPSSTSA